MTGAVPERYSTREGLLDLLASYFPRGHERVREIAAELDFQRHGGFAAPKTILIILFASRAGSNYFGQLLSSTGWFREVGESFKPGQLTKIRNRFGLRDLHEAAQWMIDNRGTRQAFGIKAGFEVLTAAAELGFLSEVLDRAQFILLRRHDRVAQAVSLVKGRLSGQMHSRQAARRQLTNRDYDKHAIARVVHQIERRERDFAEIVQKLGKAAPVVHYEEVCARPQEHVAMVCHRLGLGMPPDYTPHVRLSVLRDELSEQWAHRFRSETGASE